MCSCASGVTCRRCREDEACYDGRSYDAETERDELRAMFANGESCYDPENDAD